jgi:hypothetical protein
MAVPIVASLLIAACDSGKRAQPCEAGICEQPESLFPQEDPFARQVGGRVVRGAEIVPGATLLLEPSPGFASDEKLRDAGDPSYATSTDLGGQYRIPNGPFFYDLSIRKEQEVAIFRGYAARYVEPPFGESPLVNGFPASVVLSTSPPPEVGNAIAAFLTGGDARSASGEAGSLDVTLRRFEADVTLIAVEFPVTDGLRAAKRFGRGSVHVRSGGTTTLVVPVLAPSARNVADVVFAVDPPPGFTLTSLEVVMDFGLRTSARRVAKAEPGVPIHLEVADGTRFYVHGAAAGPGGARSDSGLQYFLPVLGSKDLQTFAVALPPPAGNVAFDGNDGLMATAVVAPVDLTTTILPVGVLEHVLVPAARDGVKLRIVTAASASKLPDLTRLGLPRPAGRYTWTVQQFPTLTRLDDFSGEDVRFTMPFAVTAPRTIELP